MSVRAVGWKCEDDVWPRLTNLPRQLGNSAPDIRPIEMLILVVQEADARNTQRA